jgi:murein DD-endopeptidase MepM/ murein hydrolase activator NlpD
MNQRKTNEPANRINFLLLNETKKQAILKSNWTANGLNYGSNIAYLLTYFVRWILILVVSTLTKIIYYIRLSLNRLINFYFEISDAIVDQEARTIFLFDIKVLYLITATKLRNYLADAWFFTKKLYLILTVTALILGLKISGVYIKPSLNSKSFINQAFDNYSQLQNKANVAPINALAITTTAKEIVNIFPLNKITVKAEQKIVDIAEAQNLKPETIQINNNLEGKDSIPKEVKELIVPWQDGYVYFPKVETSPGQVAEKFKLDEKIIYEANEDKLGENRKFGQGATIIIPTSNFAEIKKVLAKEKQLLQLEEQAKQVKDNQSKLSKSYQDQFSSPSSGAALYANTKSEDKAAAGLIWPTKGSISRCIQPGHPGCDIANPGMPPVYAVADGVVTDVYRFTVYGYGNAVVIDHGNGLTSLSAHLNEIYVTKGQSVTQGQAIGQMGNTGNSTGTHLHIEIKLNKVAQNPLAYFP